MVSIKGTTIEMTRGDTARIPIKIMKSDGTQYTPSSTDSVVFTAKSNYSDTQAVIQKTIPINTMLLEIQPNDTKNLKMPSKYVYDIQLTKQDGTVSTFISKSILSILEEVG